MRPEKKDFSKITNPSFSLHCDREALFGFTANHITNHIDFWPKAVLCIQGLIAHVQMLVTILYT
jgi:hypothetical protein